MELEDERQVLPGLYKVAKALYMVLLGPPAALLAVIGSVPWWICISILSSQAEDYGRLFSACFHAAMLVLVAPLVLLLAIASCPLVLAYSLMDADVLNLRSCSLRSWISSWRVLFFMVLVLPTGVPATVVCCFGWPFASFRAAWNGQFDQAVYTACVFIVYLLLSPIVVVVIVCCIPCAGILLAMSDARSERSSSDVRPLEQPTSVPDSEFWSVDGGS